MGIPSDKPLKDKDFLPDEEEVMEDEEEGEEDHPRGCGGKYYRLGCRCEHCSDRGDWEMECRRDRKLLEGE